MFSRHSLFLIGLLLIGVSSFAQSVPSLISVTRTSTALLTAGGAVTYTVNYSPGSNPVTFVSVTLADASGAERTVLSVSSPSSGGTLSLTSNATWLNGAYTISRVNFQDSAGRLALYQRSGDIIVSPTLSGAPSRHSVNFSSQDFQITGGLASASIPTLTAVTRTSAASLTAGGAVTYTVSYAPGSNPVTFVSVTLADASGAERTVLSVSSPSSGGTLSLTSNATWLNGAYTISRVNFQDSAGRLALYRRSGDILVSPTLIGAPTSHSVNFSSQDFQITGGLASASIPTLTAVTRTSAASLTAGGAVTYTVSYAPGSNPVTSVSITLADASGAERTVPSVSSASSGGALSLTSNSTWLNGAYTISRVNFQDSAGRLALYRRSGDILVSPTLIGAPSSHSVNFATQDFLLGVTSANGPLTITTQPAAQSVTAGASVVLTVVAVGSGPISYQWRKNGVTIAGATNATLSLVNVQPSDAATYTVMVSNGPNSVTSSDASVSVTPSNLAPVFTLQPGNATATDGGGFTVDVKVTSSNFSNVTWKANVGSRSVNALSSAVVQSNNNFTASLAFGPVTLADAGNFQVVATNAYGSTLSSTKTLTVTPLAPSITTEPQDQSVNPGSRLSLVVAAAGSGTLHYQWRKNGSPINGATNATFAIVSVQLTDAGSYSTVVTNDTASATSRAAVVTVTTLALPIITTQPLAVSVAAGFDASFQVTATGSNLAYQWQKNGNAISGATTPNLILQRVTPADTADYSVAIANTAGRVLSNLAGLTVLVAPTITAEPQDQSLILGSNLNLTVTATGAGTLRYQWRKNGSPIEGSTNATYTIASVQLTDAGSYSAVVANDTGNVTSRSAVVVVSSLALPFITSQPVAVAVAPGSDASFQVTAAGFGLSYQWQRNGSAIPGATTSQLILRSVTQADSADYSVAISSSAGGVVSNPAALTVLVAPSITQPPRSDTVAEGAYVSFDVTASGSAPLTYQWFCNGNALLGATRSSLLVGPLTAADAAEYYAVVSNPAGTARSAVAVLTVQRINPARLVNLSILTALRAEESFTLGFVVAGTGTKPLLIRAVGPTLSQFGVASPHADPKVVLYAGGTATDENDNWGGSSAAADAAAQVGAFAFASSDSKDAMIFAPAVPLGANSAQISGMRSASGLVLAEIYETTPANQVTSSSARLVNVSVLKDVGNGITAGFVIGGNGQKTILLRAIGPSLNAFGVAAPIADPNLRLYDSTGSVIASNDDWQNGDAAIMARVGAFALPASSKDSALVVTLPPGTYTVQVSSPVGSTGTGLVEVYEVP